MNQLIELQPGTAVDPDQVTSVRQGAYIPRSERRAARFGSASPSHGQTQVTLRDGRRFDIDAPYDAVHAQINTARTRTTTTQEVTS